MRASVRKRSFVADQAAQFQHDGFVTVPRLFEPQQIAEIRDTFMAIAGQGPVAGLSEFKSASTRGGTPDAGENDPLAFYPRMLHPHNHADKPVGPLSMRYMLHPLFEPLLTALFADEPVAVQSMFYFKPPGSRGQALHQDNFYLRVKPKTCIAAWLAIDDADAENGAMQCVRNTRDYPVQCPEPADLAESFTTEWVKPPAGNQPDLVALQAGDVLFFNGNVIHGSGPNRSPTRFRRAFIFHYVPLGSVELSHWYATPYRFNGDRLVIPAATGGSACGNVELNPQSPH